MAVIHATPEQIEEYMGEQPYAVVRCDLQAHIVEDKVSGAKGFAVFESIAEGDDEILAEATPSLIMYSCDDGKMTLSVSNPDLALYSGPSDEIFDEEGKRVERSIYGRKWVNNHCSPTTVRVVLDGNWNVAAGSTPAVSARRLPGYRTELVFTTGEARTEEISLIKTK